MPGYRELKSLLFARVDLNVAAALDGHCAVVVKYKLNEPFWSLGELLAAQEHRFYKRDFRLFLSHRNLSHRARRFASFPLAVPFPTRCTNCDLLILGVQSNDSYTPPMRS